MVRMSKYSVKAVVIDKISELMFEVLGKANNKQKFINSVNEVLSPVERLMVGKRLLIMYLVFIGISYDVICGAVKVSRATVSKFVYILDRSVAIKNAFLSIAAKDRVHKTINELMSSVFEPGLSMGSWKNSSQFKRRIQEQKRQGI